LVWLNPQTLFDFNITYKNTSFQVGI